METSKKYWAVNLKFLRGRNKLSQDQLSELLGMSRSKYNAHENGQTLNPPVEDLLRISEYYKISIDNLLRTDLAALSAAQLKELEAGNDSYRSGARLRVLAISVDKEDKENVEYVPVKARAGYRSGYNDPEFIAGLPRYSMPNLPAGGTFRMFPTTGDSMLPIPEGSDVLCRYVQDWDRIKPGTLCIVILEREQELVFKRLTMEKNGEVLLESLNKQYQPYKVPVSDILEVWQFHSYQSSTIPEPEPDLQDMARALRGVQEELKRLQGRK